MNAIKRISRVYEASERVKLNDSSRIILMSDCHRGDGSQADEFFRNENLYLAAMHHYYKQGYTYIEIGDGDELWENKQMADIVRAHPQSFEMLRRFYLDNRIYFIYGNHDMIKRDMKYDGSGFFRDRDAVKGLKGQNPLLSQGIKLHEGLVLQYQSGRPRSSSGEIFLIHGHQVDFFNSSLWRFSRFLVRYFWRPMELFGISNPTSPAQNPEKKERIGKHLTDWAIRENRMLIAGHNHRPMFSEPGEPMYYNDGSCVHPLFITGIEIDRGKIALIKWSVKVREGGNLFVGRDVIAGPVRLGDLFRTKRSAETCSFHDPTEVSFPAKPE